METFIQGGPKGETVFGSDGDDKILGSGGGDWLEGRGGVDYISAGYGSDRSMGGEGNDKILGEQGFDHLSGDNGRYKPRIVGEDNDFIDGGPNDDFLYVGDGKDYLTGGADKDTFVFQFHDPVPGVDSSGSGEPVDPKPWMLPDYPEWPGEEDDPLIGGWEEDDPLIGDEPGEPGGALGVSGVPDITTIQDFDPKEDTFAFDAVGLYNDGFGANFINNASPESGHPVSSFYSGKASDANGEHVVVITDKSFTSASDAANAISGETVGDIIVYHSDGRTGLASLAYVTAENQAEDFTHLGGVDSLADLANLGLTASDFTFV
ncbi:calcium-binding protein [Mesorhizobium loti]|uniref:Hemolysin expression modulating protein n=1 Tax=Rhizobium loti TaxID=381 RepID=M5AMF4_RHILI|nr:MULTISPECIES: calcium-binding protein [Mesorhizobium]ANN61860.1 hemolysin expression modulating protein [Mesorhizobium loti NZP2037]OBP78568.1 hemolysin expression modulating protein [Mesorhizobium loti]OBP98413.1 hemolysin expression modulating protein [Mesorhizobium loti]OBQ59152.1 hemolysin expression modulating protein [Mesorhizobium loti]OBQ70024.1 hemolysin expression modulating protein [Mesorhizobium loti]